MANQFPKTSSINRKNAIACGQKVYDGVPCKTCGSTKKHVSSYSCVNCNIKRNLPKLYDSELMCKYRTKDKVALYWKNNPDKFKAKNDRYNNSEKGKIANTNKAAKRRASVRNQLPVDANLDIIKSIYEECRRLSVETGIPHEVDHIIPIAKGGLHHQDNLQILTMSENRKKGSNIL
jgi:5-methylcytosine-specific restriction endonuclease McrA